jgi:hypothetical protein
MAKGPDRVVDVGLMGLLSGVTICIYADIVLGK